jgi:microcystin-dependent protein
MKMKAALVVGLGALALLCSPSARAQEQFLGEIRWVAFDFAPVGWAQCQGQILPINQNQALFALLGTTFGGDGKSTFALPDLRSRVAVGDGQGTGLSSYVIGQTGGQESVTLSIAQLAPHAHPLSAHTHPIPPLAVSLPATSAAGTTTSPAGNLPATTHQKDYHPGPANTQLAAGATTAAASTGSAAPTVGTTGGGQPVPTVMPYQALHCIIALTGIFPSRN